MHCRNYLPHVVEKESLKGKQQLVDVMVMMMMMMVVAGQVQFVADLWWIMVNLW